MRYAGCAAYFFIVGASLFALLRVCERCGTDNAYLGQLLLGLLSIALGLLFAVVWLVASRRQGGRGALTGAVPAIGVASVILVIGASRTLVPPALFPVELALLFVGAAAALALPFRRTPTRAPSRHDA